MKIYDIVQWSIVIGVVVFSALYMLGRIAPQWRLQLAQQLQQPHHARWVNKLGERLVGRSGCGSCDACGPSKSSAKKKPSGR